MSITQFTHTDLIALSKRIEQAEAVLGAARADRPRAEWPWSLQLLEYLMEEAENALHALQEAPQEN